MILLTLFFSAFTSATLLPGSSEVLFLYLHTQGIQETALLILVAGFGNSLGGMVNWLLGLLIHMGLYKKHTPGNTYKKVEHSLQKFGSPLLFFSFLPIIGDPLCVAAGVIKLHWFQALIFISAGKFFRYFLLSMI